ncbi:DUF3618 domain-containing protein [Rhodospirillaceae bacterium SYSU D60014]|uniref:DUF3618 domain-containing protein n=1 Tax=Virgifigura deserti TaxID=2268457 RepID=UPI000E660167
MAESNQEKDNSGKSAAEIEREIGQTRAEIDDTLDRIFDRLTPGQAFEQAIDYFRRSNGVSTFGIAVKNNPVPALLATISIGWLIAATMRERARQSELTGTRLPSQDFSDRSIAGRMAEANAGTGETWEGDDFEPQRAQVFTVPAGDRSETSSVEEKEPPARR